jgi:hypothetical protein
MTDARARSGERKKEEEQGRKQDEKNVRRRVQEHSKLCSPLNLFVAAIWSGTEYITIHELDRCTWYRPWKGVSRSLTDWTLDGPAVCCPRLCCLIPLLLLDQNPVRVVRRHHKDRHALGRQRLCQLRHDSRRAEVEGPSELEDDVRPFCVACTFEMRPRANHRQLVGSERDGEEGRFGSWGCRGKASVRRQAVNEDRFGQEDEVQRARRHSFESFQGGRGGGNLPPNILLTNHLPPGQHLTLSQHLPRSTTMSASPAPSNSKVALVTGGSRGTSRKIEHVLSR